MRDHSGLVIDAFRGTFDRGEDDTTPAGYFLSSQNWEFITGGIVTRDGIVYDVNALPVGIKVARIEIYERTGEAQRLLVLDNTGKIWDSVTGLMILSIPAMTDFSVTIMFDRAFITPHNGLVGLAGEKVYIYEGSGAARPAAGVGPPEAPPMKALDSALSGFCEDGLHIFACAFESTSGNISGLGAFTSFSPAGDKQVRLEDIPIGPAGTVARILFSTKEIDEPTSDYKNQTYYFIPEGRIADNTTTVKEGSFFDADLMEDASYLLEQLTEIPAGVGIGQYKGRLIVWGENANNSIIRVSHAGEPEAHNGVDGYVTVYPGVGGGVRNCTEYRNQLLIFKSRRTYSTQDNDNEAVYWDVGEVDGSVGTECHGIGQILNIGSNVEDRLFIADRGGLRVFIGTFNEDGVLTYNIDDIWSRITKTAFEKIEVSIDADNALIYVAVPLDGATSPTHLLYGDYSEGLTAETIRWTLWQFPIRPTSVVISLVNNLPILKFGSLDGRVVKIQKDEQYDLGQTIACACKFPLFPVGGVDEQVHHVTGITMRARGEGALGISAEGLDGTNRMQVQSIVLTPAPGYPLFRGFNFTSERCSVSLVLNQPGAYMYLTKFILYMTPVWEGRAQVG